MAYPIASLPGGGVLYSDGSKRYPPAPQSSQTNPNAANYRGPVTPQSSQTNPNAANYQGRQTSNPTYTPNIAPVSGNLTADVLRSRFGFNDPNVINRILSDPNEVARYMREMGDAPQSRNPLVKPTAPVSNIQKPTNYSDKVNTVKDTNTSFSDKLLEATKGTLIQNNPLLKMLDQTGQLKPGSAVRQGLGNSIENLSMLFWEPFNEGKPFQDFNISEMVAGGPTKNTVLASSGKNENILSGSESNQVVRQSRPNNQSNPTQDKFKTDLSNLDKSIKGDVNAFKPTDVLGASTDGDAWALVDDTYDEVNKLYMEGAISEGEAQKRIKDAELAALDAQFNKLNTNYDLLVPEYEQQAENAIGDIETNLGRAKASGLEQNAYIDNTYGSALRKAVKNAQQLTNQRRNIFSNLNTAESSAFIDQQTNADVELGRDLNLTEREKAGKIATVNKTIADYETDANKEIARIKQDKDAKLLKVKESKRLSESDKEVERGKILAEYEANLADIQNNLNTNKIAQIGNKQNFADQLALITAQGKVDEGLLNTQSNLEKQAYGLASQIPFELDSEIKGFFKAPYSSPTKSAQLKAKYPQWAELIDGVLSGQLSVQDYIAQTSGASNVLG